MPWTGVRGANTGDPLNANEIAVSVTELMQARRLDSRIRLMSASAADGITKLVDLIAEAKEDQIHVALGFASWTAYLADALCEFNVAVNAASRRELVAVMADEGMSNRAIAQAVGVNEITVRRDKEQVRHDVAPVLTDALSRRPRSATLEQCREPAQGDAPTITGLDGKTYTSKQSGTPRRTPLPNAAVKVSLDLGRVLNRLRNLLDDDRFDANREVIIRQFRPNVMAGLELFGRLDDSRNGGDG